MAMRKIDWRRVLKLYFMILILGFFALQFRRFPRTNPPDHPSKAWAGTVQFTPEVAAILDRSCNDCHSNRTRWPWYSNVAPVSWSVIDHVNSGRRHLNFSELRVRDGQDTIRALRRKLSEIDKEIVRGKMPMWSYCLIHRNAYLSSEDVGTIRDWVTEERERLAALLPPRDTQGIENNVRVDTSSSAREVLNHRVKAL